MIYHADMYACPGMDEAVLKHLYPGSVVSATRIEPPLHPDGPEKVLQDFGIEPEEFDEEGLMTFLENTEINSKNSAQQDTLMNPEATTSTGPGSYSNGIFAPWVIYKDDFQSIGGHDPLYAPQSKEDSDIFNSCLYT